MQYNTQPGIREFKDLVTRWVLTPEKCPHRGEKGGDMGTGPGRALILDIWTPDYEVIHFCLC